MVVDILAIALLLVEYWFGFEHKDDLQFMHGKYPVSYTHLDVYKRQELARTMGQFSNFAISFSIICILSGGINSLAQGTSGAGGAALSIGWIVGGACALLFSLGMAQIASAFPTAGGLYHWSSILGGRGWGWATAWFNLIGLITVLAAINVGTYSFFNGAFGAAVGIQAPADGAPFYATTQFWFVAIMNATHASVSYTHLDV